MKLIGSLGSPYVRKVRIVLAEKKMECDFVLENVWEPTTTIEKSNPIGKIPVLVLDDGVSVYDSRVIVEYLDARAPTHRLIPESGRERTEVKTWEALTDGVLDAAVLVFHENKRPQEQRSPTWVARQLTKVDRGLTTMSRDLGKNPWCHGKSFSLADIAVGATLGWLSFRFPEIDWRSAHPNLASHYEKLMQRPSFSETVPK
jgi:glutathione S-transferase